MESVYYPAERRAALWQRMAEDFKNVPGRLLEMVEQRAALEEVPEAAQRILAGQVRGRVLVQPG